MTPCDSGGACGGAREEGTGRTGLTAGCGRWLLLTADGQGQSQEQSGTLLS